MLVIWLQAEKQLFQAHQIVFASNSITYVFVVVWPLAGVSRPLPLFTLASGGTPMRPPMK